VEPADDDARPARNNAAAGYGMTRAGENDAYALISQPAIIPIDCDRCRRSSGKYKAMNGSLPTARRSTIAALNRDRAVPPGCSAAQNVA
jgi:hypothetical protein